MTIYDESGRQRRWTASRWPHASMSQAASFSCPLEPSEVSFSCQSRVLSQHAIPTPMANRVEMALMVEAD